MAARRPEFSMALDIPALVAETGSIRKAGADGHFGEIGSWHTHPRSHDGRPSPQDLAAWLNGHDFLDGRPYVGVILTAERSDERWSRPSAHAWIVRRDGARNRPICERAVVEINGAPRTPPLSGVG